METFTLHQRFQQPVECAVLDSYEYTHCRSGERLTAMLLLPIDAPLAGTHLIRIALQDGRTTGAAIWSPLDVLGTEARVFGEWRDERRGECPTSPAWDSIRSRFERALRVIHPKFSPADVAEKTTEIKEAS